MVTMASEGLSHARCDGEGPHGHSDRDGDQVTGGPFTDDVSNGDGSSDHSDRDDGARQDGNGPVIFNNGTSNGHYHQDDVNGHDERLFDSPDQPGDVSDCGDEALSRLEDDATNTVTVSVAVCSQAKRGDEESCASSGMDCEIDGDRVIFAKTPDTKRRIASLMVVESNQEFPNDDSSRSIIHNGNDPSSSSLADDHEFESYRCPPFNISSLGDPQLKDQLTFIVDHPEPDIPPSPHSLPNSININADSGGSLQNPFCHEQADVNSLHPPSAAVLPRPRSCSGTLEMIVPLAMMSPFLVASSPLTRSSPSLLHLQQATGPDTIADTMSSLRLELQERSLNWSGNSRELRSSSKRLQPKGFPSWSKLSPSTDHTAVTAEPKTTRNCRSCKSSSHPLSVPRNLFRRSSLQTTKPAPPPQIEVDPNSFSDDERKLHSTLSRKQKPKPTLEGHRSKDKPSFAMGKSIGESYSKRQSSGFGDIFQLKSSRVCSSSAPGSGVPSVAVVPPMQDVSQSDNAESTNSGTLTRGVPAPEPSDHHTSSSSSSGGGGVVSPPCQSTPEAAPPLPTTPGRPVPKHSPIKNSGLSSKHSSPAKSVTGGGPALEDSDTPDSEDLSSKQSAGGLSLEAVVCPNQHTHHTGREIINKIYAISIDALFTLLFTNSKMMLDVHAARKTIDVLASPWQSKEDTHQRLRQVTYTVALPTNSFGPKVSHVTETQVMSELTVPGEYYSIDAEASNAGIPYADSFLVSNHWCLTRETSSETRLVVWTSVKYKKSMWGFMKGVIDKNACSGVECLLTDIDTALQREVAQQSDLRQRTRRRRRRPITKMADTEPGAGASAAASPGGAGQQAGAAALLGKENKPVKEPKQALVSTVTRILGAPVNPLGSHRHAPLITGGAALQSARSTQPSFAAAEESSFFSGGIKLVVGALMLLLLTNMLLYWRLWQLEAIVRGQPTLGGARGLLDIDPGLLGMGVGGALGEAWLQVLQEQEAAHSRQVEGWREQVAEAASLLNQAEGVLRGLHSNIPEQHAVSVRALLARLRSLDQQHTVAHKDQPLHIQHSGDPPHYLKHQDGGDHTGDGGVHHPPEAENNFDDRGAALSDHGSHFDHHDHLDDDDNHVRQAPDNVANAAS